MNSKVPTLLQCGKDLGYDATLTGLESLNGDMVAASCRSVFNRLRIEYDRDD